LQSSFTGGIILKQIIPLYRLGSVVDDAQHSIVYFQDGGSPWLQRTQ